MIKSLKGIGTVISQTLPWVNLAVFIALASAVSVVAMLLIGIMIIKRLP
jgi:hypothetical protein